MTQRCYSGLALQHSSIASDARFPETGLGPFFKLMAALACTTTISLAQPVNIHDIPNDLVVPAVTAEQPSAGKRVRRSLPLYESWDLFHVLYLPRDWKPAGQYAVIVEFPGNGGYQNQLGDKSSGRVEDCKLGYGISAGERFIWVCLPFVDTQAKQHALNWWGNADATAAYCRAVVERVCQNFGGDRERVILTGFSRGAIACNYIGLRDDQTAKLWRAMIVHSHYDGVRAWGYVDDDAKSAQIRLERFKNGRQFITQEKSIDDIHTFLDGLPINSTLAVLPYPNHTDAWVLKDIPLRAQLREWLDGTLKQKLPRAIPSAARP